MLLLGKKQNMTQVFDESGKCFPVTVVSTGSMTVTQVKSKAADGYDAVQIGYDSAPISEFNKAAQGKFTPITGIKSAGFKNLKEFRMKKGVSDMKVGDIFDASVLKEGDKVIVSSVSKAKGFQSVIKRHGFKGQPRSHGQKHCENAPGSIGGGLRNKVPKGMRMAGRMGGERVTIKGLTVVKVDKDNNLVLLKGAIPGRKGTLVEIYN